MGGPWSPPWRQLKSYRQPFCAIFVSCSGGRWKGKGRRGEGECIGGTHLFFNSFLFSSLPASHESTSIAFWQLAIIVTTSVVATQRRKSSLFLSFSLSLVLSFSLSLFLSF